MAIVALPLAATSAFASTAVTVKNPGGLTAVGPVNTQDGFPAWYEDRNGTRLELCMDGANPLCGPLTSNPDQTPPYDAAQPTVFPDNFPDEAFYFLASSLITFPNGGKATLTLGLEGAFANTVTNGDQITFARQRIFVKGGPANTTITFTHPYGTITIDTDAAGDGRLTEDISPAAGNFATPLKGNLGPFLQWTPDPTLPAGYLGDPGVDHTVTGGPLRNTFDASWAGGTASQNLFSVLGKKSTNVGVTADAAVVDGNFLDLFATSEADPGELYVAANGAVPSTPMQADAVPAPPAGGPPPAPVARPFYARIDMTGKTVPDTITVRNIGDNPVSTSQITVTKPSGITISSARFDGTNLTVAATDVNPTATLKVNGFPTATFAGGTATIPTVAPPMTVSVTDGTGTATAPVTIAAGGATAPGLEPSAVTPDPGPVCDPAPCGAGGPVSGTTPTVTIAAVPAAARGDTVTLDGSATTNATAWQWTQTGGTPVTLTGGTASKASFQLPLAATTTPTAPNNGNLTFTLKATNGNGGQSATGTATVTIKPDALVVTGSRFRAGQEIRIDGTSLLPGGPLVLSPTTTVAVYVAAGQPGAGKLVGTAQVDTTGAWTVRPRSTTGFTAFTAVTAVSSRGGSTTFTGGTTR
jgi:hypothetical protein